MVVGQLVLRGTVGCGEWSYCFGIEEGEGMGRDGIYGCGQPMYMMGTLF